jgi:hypothetical protein
MTKEDIKTKDLRLSIIKAGYAAVEQLIKVAKDEIVVDSQEDELSADKMKNAAQAKKIAVFDAFEILNRIEQERTALSINVDKEVDTKVGFAERRSNK